MTDHDLKSAPANLPNAPHGHPEHVHSEACGHDHSHDQHHFAPVHTLRRAGPKVGRNDPCPCGSGKKHKKCCMDA
jgi:uncharacterized protein YchJ